jgi:hypothetical protein
MCPICWGTALVSFGGIVAISVLSIAGNDKVTLAIAAALGLSFLLDRFAVVTAPWYFIILLIVLIAVRVAYMIYFRWHELLLSKAWVAARQIAARRCPKIRE